MKLLSYSFETILRFSAPVSDHSFILRCQPKSTPLQKVIDSQIILHPRCSVDEQIDGFGNRLCAGYLPDAHESFSFMSYGLVLTDGQATSAEEAHPMFLQQSAYTGLSDALRAFVRECLQTVSNADAWTKAQLLMHAVYSHFSYVPGSTDVKTTAAQAFDRAQGVCQDYAQVLIAACRAAGVPARYCAGLMVGEGATHAWVEVHDGTNWRGLDPTHDRAVDDDYLVISCGRDFEDCSIERGVFRGNALQTQEVYASVAQGEGMAAADGVASVQTHSPELAEAIRGTQSTNPSFDAKAFIDGMKEEQQ